MTTAGDFLCNLHAASANAKGKWHAFLAIPASDAGPAQRAADRVLGAGPWKRMDGAVAFPTRTALLVGPASPLSINEYGAAIGDGQVGVWTGTGGDGAASSIQRSCGAWTYGKAAPFNLVTGTTGNATVAGAGYMFTGEAPCNAQNRLYCFEE
jgi:hypothetical protein